MNGSIPTTSSSSLAQYSSISTLERQHAPPLGQRLMLFVEANAACCLEGGVESILKLKHGNGNGNGNGNGTDHLSSGAVAAEPQLFEEDPQDDFDAFAFLQEQEKEQEGGMAGSGFIAGSTTTTTTTTTTTAPKKKGLGRFLKQVAASTGATLDRQMQGLAVRLDKGRNPDLVRVAMYDPQTQELLGVTNAQPLLTRQAIRFAIPLVVSGHKLHSQMQLKLWIQSGAALLQSTKAAKNYLLGQATVDCSTELVLVGGITAIPLHSLLIVGGQLSICTTIDEKFAQVAQRGWSLTDPDMSGYASQLHYLPLDQSYLLGTGGPSPTTTMTPTAPQSQQDWWMATERATESTVVLPLAAAVMELSFKATQRSLYHAQSVAKILRANRHDYKDPTKAVCTLGVVGISMRDTTFLTPQTQAQGASLSISWRRPDSIFELELAANTQVPICRPDVAAAFPSFTTKFYPKPCVDGILPGVLRLHGGQLPPATGYLLGQLYFCVTLEVTGQMEMWECMVGMESFVNATQTTIQVPLYKQGQPMGHLLVQLQVTLPSEPVHHRVISATDGLVSLMGLETYQEGVEPKMDNPTDFVLESTLRHQQLATMGYFCTTQYMEQHLALRQSGMESFEERARAYKQALVQPEPNVEPHQVKSPKAFRPSSARMEALLSGIPFNAHNVVLNVTVRDANHHPNTNNPNNNNNNNNNHGPELPGACFHNITCGAPADHARGFGNVLQTISNYTNVSGGLRRLEAKRWECAQALQQAQSLLIAGVGNYLSTARRSGQVNHVPARHAEIQGLRWKTFECVHNLHHVTWMCAVRRANVFSQSLGLALSSYLAAVSDANKCAAGWPALWKRHGYLVGFEGLLSAAGKELGMIEDASVAIAMLRMVKVVLMPDTGIPSKAVAVSASPHVKWVNLFASGFGTSRTYLLQVGVEANYYTQRIPVPLQNGTAVQLYPLLYQVGVDIRQWGAHAGSNLMTKQRDEVVATAAPTGGLVDDEDDDAGTPDTDVLVALNYEALHKLNAYAHAVTPASVLLDRVQAAMIQVFNTHPSMIGQSQQQPLPVHPSLSALHSHILSSAGKMNHQILDEAATIVQQLGGGGLVFCKSGKDRTAMHVTYKQAQFAARYKNRNAEWAETMELVLRDATLLRIHGTRLPICEKNVGQSKYAFNALQVKFMPDALKPPMNTLAGFLKGGRLFSSEGAIES